MQILSSMRRDFIAGHIRSQIDKLHTTLSSMEEDIVDYDYATNSLKEIEANLRQIRKLFTDN